MEKKEKKEEKIGEVKQEKKNDYTWLIIACIGGFLVFIILTFITLNIFLIPYNVIEKVSKNPEQLLEETETILDRATEKIFDEDNEKNDETENETEKSLDKVIDAITGEVKRDRIDDYNESLEDYFGTNEGIDVKELIDEVVIKMKKNKDHIIKVTYKEKTTSEINELISLKKAFKDENRYEVIMDYNNDGYIYKITITDY